jgi:hypothetical protein
MLDLDVVEGRRSWAREDLAEEAAVELLVRSFRGRFADLDWPWIRSCDRRGWFWVDADVMPDNWGALSGGEQRILALVAALMGSLPIDDLGLAFAGLDRTHLELVLAAVAHAGGSHQFSGISEDDGQLRLVRLDSLFSWPGEPARVV